LARRTIYEGPHYAVKRSETEERNRLRRKTRRTIRKGKRGR
jgi:hypothetical protein